MANYKTGRSDKLMTPEFRVSFPHLFEPWAGKDGKQTPKYGITMSFSQETDITKLKQAAEIAVRARWGDNIPSDLEHPFRVGNKQAEKYPEWKDCTVIASKSISRPGVVDENVQPVIDPAKVYAGCYAQATINAYTYDGPGNPGVTFGLGNVQFVRDGEPLGFRSRPEDEFEPVAKEDADWGDGVDTRGTKGQGLFG